MTEAGADRQVRLVLAAIARIEQAHAVWQAMERDAAASSGERQAAFRRYQASVREFGWQWPSVKALLEERRTS
jgi:hypothetical protein